ncbi:MAG TPA: hydrolase, partial [Leptospiraceae bacterium]|nr:hydrolase [Leptospiraceae bacterium]
MNQKKSNSKKFSFPTMMVLLILLSIVGGFVLFLLSVILLIAFLFYPIYKRYFLRKYPVQDIADEVSYAVTEDGWNLAIHRHKPMKPLPNAYPVIVVHGIITNKYFMDLDVDHSLAYHLKL